MSRVDDDIKRRSRYCSATHPFRTTKPKIRILGIVVPKGCVALHSSVHFFFFTVFLFRATIVIEGEGIGARSVRFPHRFCVCPTLYGRVVRPVVSVHTFRYTWPWAGRADTKTVWEPYRSCADTLPLDHDRCAKEKNRKKKSGRSSVVLRTLSVLQYLADVQDTYPYTCTYPWKGLGSASLVTF